jgi:hypothetical protein
MENTMGTLNKRLLPYNSFFVFCAQGVDLQISRKLMGKRKSDLQDFGVVIMFYHGHQV